MLVERVRIHPPLVTGYFQQPTTGPGQGLFRSSDQRPSDPTFALLDIDHQRSDTADRPLSVQHRHLMQSDGTDKAAVAPFSDQRCVPGSPPFFPACRNISGICRMPEYGEQTSQFGRVGSLRRTECKSRNDYFPS